MKLDWLPNEEHEKKLLENEAKFIFEQAEKQLKDTVETSQQIVTRTTSLITLVVGIMSAMVGYAFTKRTEISTDVFTTLMIGSLYLFSLSCYLIHILKPRLYNTIGSTPRALFADHFFKEEFDKERLLEYYKCEIINYQQRITDNQKINAKRWGDFKRSLWSLVASPLVLGVIYYLFIRC